MMMMMMMMMMVTYQPRISNCRLQSYTLWHPQYDNNPLLLHYSSDHRLPSLDFAPNTKQKRAAWKSKKSSRRHFHKKTKKPSAPRNTSSFIIYAKKSGGIVSSSSPLSPAVLPTPIFSPTKEMVVEMAKERWGVDGYGSMNGLIRLVHVEDVGLSRFEIVYPVDSGGGGVVARLEEGNVHNIYRGLFVL